MCMRLKGVTRYTYLRFEIAMKIAELVEFIHRSEHLADVEPGMLFLENSRVVEQRSEVTTGNIFHGQINVLRVLEGIQKPDQPRGLSGCQDVSFDQNMPDL